MVFSRSIKAPPQMKRISFVLICKKQRNQNPSTDKFFCVVAEGRSNKNQIHDLYLEKVGRGNSSDTIKVGYHTYLYKWMDGSPRSLSKNLFSISGILKGTTFGCLRFVNYPWNSLGDSDLYICVCVSEIVTAIQNTIME